MKVISKKKLRDYYLKNTQAEIPLIEWYLKIKHCHAKNIYELKALFNNVDSVNGYTVFNIGGNNYRLITAIHYNTERCYIRACWTHAQYDKKANQERLNRGEL